MLHSIKDLYGKKLGALDGKIGHVKDFYFDDHRWVIRYVVANTGSWLLGKQVLISPHAFGNLHQEEDCLSVNLTKQQIEDSPPIEEHKPVSRQYEEEYFRYYGWPIYWEGAGFYGLSASIPMVLPEADTPANDGTIAQEVNDSHLRSTDSIRGHHIETSEGMIGHVIDFLMDEQGWTISKLVVETGHWFAGKEIVISPKDINHISYERCSVMVNISQETIRNSEEYHVPHR